MGRRSGAPHTRDATRRAILNAALDLFVTAGYGQVSMRNIASKVGYSPGAIYSYFESKDDIFLALAEEGFRQLGATELATGATADALQDLADAAWRLYSFSKEQPQYFALVFLDRQLPAIARECERFAFMSEIKGRMFARVQRCIDEGLFPASLCPALALRILWASVIGIASLRLSGRLAPGEDADALVAAAISTTLAGLQADAVALAPRFGFDSLPSTDSAAVA